MKLNFLSIFKKKKKQMELSGFIEVHCMSDAEPVLIRTDSISSVYANPSEQFDWGTKPAYTTIEYGGVQVDVRENYEDVKELMWRADL